MHILQTRISLLLGTLLIAVVSFLAFSGVLVYDRQQTDQFLMQKPLQLNLENFKKSEGDNKVVLP